jgi:predicted Ser/Thr protein kinase
MTAESIKQLAETENLEILEVLKENATAQVLLVKKQEQTRILKIYPRSGASALLFNNYERILRKLGLTHWAGQSDDYYYLILDYFGLDLKTMLNRGALSKTQRRQIAVNLVNQVETLHQRKIVHNDIKPSNIVVNKTNQVQLIDFEEAVLWTESDAHHPRSNRRKDVQDLTAVLELLHPSLGRSLIGKTRTLGVLRTKLKIPPPFQTLRWTLTGGVFVLCSIIGFDAVSVAVSSLGRTDATISGPGDVSFSSQTETVGQNLDPTVSSPQAATELANASVNSRQLDPGVLPLVTISTSNFNSADPRSVPVRAQAEVGGNDTGAAALPVPAPTSAPPSDPAAPSPSPEPVNPPAPAPTNPAAPVNPAPQPTLKPQPTPEPSDETEIIVIN